MNSNKKETILITGATGTLGKRLLKEVKKSPRIGKIILLVRGESDEMARQRVLDNPNSSGIRDLKVYASDITKNKLGLGKDLYTDISQEVTQIIHCAANVKFSLPLDETRLINHHGTANLIDLAKKCRNLSKFGHVSTAYVAGKRRGVIYENELEHNAGFISSYEQSKYETEILVRKNLESLPINVFRPTILLENESRNAVNYMLKLFYEGSLPIIPGDKRGHVDLVPVDYCAFAIWRVFDKYFSQGKTYHIVAGPENSYTLEELVERVVVTFSKYKPLRKPKFVQLNEFQALILKKLADTKIGVFRKLNTFATQLLYPKIFDNTNLKNLKDKNLRPRRIETYFDQYLSDFLRRNTND
ncbi:MAG: hypothetical protein A2113_01495 [Candidatus Woykebacteria bacterium GWA1_44_8]|uniref:Thioester reductase (TE) domain-containing protein n=1 Tax=Candidatus Woykebacteria bacterium GWA1_44_8 TaxID=1802591 RepID=A0A1G1W034_9BACT|nr:MAG: hypothetical protein A2113_01495 [Candidatus Woykebacteria bacterium GWA1_44_8]